MSKQSLFAVNAIMAISFALQAAIGIRLWLSELIEWEEPELWESIHLINGLLLIVLVAVHLYMNRMWIKTQLSSSKGKN